MIPWGLGISKEGVEAQGAAGSHSAFSIERKKEGVGEQRDVQRTCGEAPCFDLTRYDVENLLVKKLVQKKDRRATVTGFLGEIGLHLRAEAVHIHGGKTRHSDGNAMHDSSRMQVRVPTRFHLVKELGALYGIAKLDASATGVIGKLKVGRIESWR